MERNSDIDQAIISYVPFFSEIRKRLLFALSIFVIAWIVGFIYYQPIIIFVLDLYDLSGVNIAFTSPFQFLQLALNSGLAVGLIAIIPILTYQIISFLRPALNKNEYKELMALVPFSFFMFIFGFAFGTWLMKFVVKMFSKQTTELQIQNLWDINNFFSQIFLTSLLLGIAFQFPIVLTLLLRLGFIKYELLQKFRFPTYGLLLGVAVLMPPTDVVSLILMFLPLALIFELTLIFNRKHAVRKSLAKNEGGEQ